MKTQCGPFWYDYQGDKTVWPPQGLPEEVAEELRICEDFAEEGLKDGFYESIDETDAVWYALQRMYQKFPDWAHRLAEIYFPVVE